ncbi:hypothetical protein EV363DRAFT_249034 [Boletus edulis]|nr:hypothetical protein EV363DRAFT_249034 [Boletus edulis]
MPRKASRSINLAEDDDDDDLSQCSKAPDNDDRDIEMYAKAVAEFKVTWQKQKKDKERKFMKTAQAELDEHVERKQAQVREIMKHMEETYQEFLSTYAAIEDKTREVMVKIIDAQKTLVVGLFRSTVEYKLPLCHRAFQALSVRKHQETVELTSNLEESQLDSIQQIKQTCWGMPLCCFGKTDRPHLEFIGRFRCDGYDGGVHEGLTLWITWADPRYVLLFVLSDMQYTRTFNPVQLTRHVHRLVVSFLATL